MRYVEAYGVITMVILGMAGCATLEEYTGLSLGGGVGGGGLITNLNLVSTEQEIQLGQQFSSEIEKDAVLLANPALQQYVADIGRRLSSMAPRQDVPYGFKVIDASDTVNAFALPGGYMYIYTGLMKLCSNEAELAAVMAHEIAHVSARHHGEMMTRQTGMELITQIALGENPGAAASLAKQLFTVGVSARFSRKQENEADTVGMDILYRAGYPPDAMIAFMNKLLDMDKKQGGGRSLPLFATHPAPEDRVALLQNLVQQYPIEECRNRSYEENRYFEQVLAYF
ncbi:MAG: M48 family metalloprotease [Candidatus Hydrogenedentes bacterium]|nr:M48 family metalloprotease [Candidatus Hydrogenedentota bacterium]